MDPFLTTSRLKLTLVTKAERGSKELEWLHELRSDEKATHYSLHGQSKTLEDTERSIAEILPLEQDPTDTSTQKQYRIVYAVHELRPSTTTTSQPPTEQDKLPSRFIGCITIRTYPANDAYIRTTLFPPSIFQPSTLTVELGYLFLPPSWGKGFATEALTAVFAACRRASATQVFWSPYEKVYVRALVSDENKPSWRVVRKCGMEELGTWVWEGEEVWFMGRWVAKCGFWVFGMEL